jgi:hypothetical protein
VLTPRLIANTEMPDLLVLLATLGGLASFRRRWHSDRPDHRRPVHRHMGWGRLQEARRKNDETGE